MNNILKKSSYYEVFVESFFDHDNDGIGDIKGLQNKLSTISQIGFTYCLIHNIFYENENSYDFYKLKKELGEEDDIENLCKKAKEIRMKIILDFSFRDLIKSYKIDIFKDEFLDIISYWKNKGVKGIRLNDVDLFFERFGDNSSSILKEIKSFCEENKLIFIIGVRDISLIDDENLSDIVYISNINSIIEKNNYRKYYELLDKLQKNTEEKYIHYGIDLTNLSYPRLSDKILDDEDESHDFMKALYILLFSLKTLPFVFQGEEIEARSEYYIDIAKINDKKIKASYKSLKNKDLSEDDIIKKIKKTTSLSSKLPLRWEMTDLGGFSKVENYYGSMVNYNNSYKEDLKNLNSFLYYIHELIMMRKINSIYGLGSYEKIYFDESAYIFKRFFKDEEFMVLVNLSDDFVLIDEKIAEEIKDAEIILNNKRDFEPEALDVYQALILKL
ncbi:hypothetical protein HV819_04125 [Anaerococcus sp. AGMB00486]|uniref:Glycosyl hydrolase family 13 catalytic domain-containing protein n=1 Tax=Anaerococcus faecalis TaxID=2742993 RepID=A0ABX2N920_9FIRM|nr:alpha-amylase family protein [Anaerococcus faecalis]NVF11179.1 hypothetical protein [Anaerococcus faecalis]